MRTCAQTNYLSIDVEDYFQVSAFEAVSKPESWAARPLRVERNTEKVLELLDEHKAMATFFVLGWVAERFPRLIQKIIAAGHEIASHGYNHQRVNNLSRREFRDDIRTSKILLENITGQPVHGYRAPSYSISAATPWAFDELLEAGYLYDSSIFPIRHDFYGVPDWPRFAGWAEKNSLGQWECLSRDPMGLRLFEVPITTLKLGRFKLPIAGGGYFRLYPYPFTRWGLRRINRREGRPFVFYVHPWEFDPRQPRVAGATIKSRFRHYVNLDKTEARFKRLLTDWLCASSCAKV